MVSFRLPWVLAAVSALAACFHDQVPKDAQLVCDGDADCPAGLKCQRAVRRCRNLASMDPNAPALDGLPQISPAVSRKGLPVAISFRATEQLAGDPTVHVGARDTVVDEEGTARTEKRYRYLYAPDGSEPQGEQVPVSVDMVDLDGHEAKDLPAGSVRFDFLPPTVVGVPVPRIAPPPRSLVDAVDSAGEGATVSVELTFDEELGEDPVLQAVWELAADPAHPKADEVLSFRCLESGLVTFAFEHVLAQATPARRQGRYVLRTTAKDAVGNEASSTLEAGFEVDTVPPADPDVATEGRIVFRREPWGTEAGGGARRMSLVGQDGAVGPGETVLSFSHDPRAELGRGVADDRGAVALPLVYVDAPKLWVQAVDGAGNASAEVLVKDLEWVATMAGKVAGSITENPHEFVSRSSMGHGLLSGVGRSYGAYPQAGEPLARVDAASAPGAPDGGGAAATVVRQSGEPVWSERDVRSWPRFGCTMGSIVMSGSPVAYDVAHEQAVLFAGDGRTWIFNGLSWRPAAVSDPEGDGDPPPRCSASLVYDERRGVTVLTSGLGGVGEVWEWNGSSWKQGAAGVGPSGRSFANVAYDRDREVVVLFGGTRLLSGTKDDTWAWDGKAWREYKPAHRPPRRYAAALTWDSASKSLLLFGGTTTSSDGAKSLLSDLWRWDGTDWTEIRPASASTPWPPAREFPTLVEDSRRGRLVLFGGRRAIDSPDLLAWEWDGSAWTSRTVDPTPLDRSAAYPALTVAPGRAAAATFYDPVRRRFVLYGGFVMFWDTSTQDWQELSLEEQWEWDPAEPSWANLTPARDPTLGVPLTPGRRMMAAMVYDPALRRTLLFGGAGGLEHASYFFGDALDDLWSWDGVQWASIPKAATWPTARAGFGMAHDPARGTTLVFGGWGSPCDTWEWDGATWTLAAAPTLPCITTAMTSFDLSGVQQTVRFGGLSADLTSGPVLTRSSQTALWSGAGWTALSGLSPLPEGRHMAAVAPDGRGGVVLFGGEASDGRVPEPQPFEGTNLNDTWLWDGTAWACALAHDATSTEGRPEPRLGHSLVFDPDRGRALLSDGWGTGPLPDYWEWDGAARAWVRRYPVNPDTGRLPTPAFARAAAYDRNRKRFVYYGGQTAIEANEEHWELDMGTGQRPGHVFSVSLAQSNLPAEAALRRVQVLAVAGGRGSGADGVELWGWLPEGWQTLASEASATPDAPAAVDARVEDSARLGRLRFQGGLHFAIVPAGANAVEPAEVVTDYVEATVRYRLP